MHQSKSGFTLIELMLTLTVLAILIGLAAPAFHDFQQRQRIVSVTNELVAHINLARMNAVTRAEVTIVCPSSDGRNCSGGNRWEQGWIVFRDADRNGQVDHTAEVLRTGAGMSSLILDSAGRNRIRYQPEGTAGGSNLTIKVCDRNHPEHARAVIVSNPGRPRTDDLTGRLRCPG